MNMANVEIALEIMAKGMGGIFVAIVVIMAAVMVLGKITGCLLYTSLPASSLKKHSSCSATSPRQEGS